MKHFRLSPDDPRLTAYALGELQGEERAAVEAVLQHDPVARAVVEQTRHFAGQMSAALGSEPELETADAMGPAIVAENAGNPTEVGSARQGGGGYHSNLPKVLRFPQLYFVVGTLAAACFAVFAILHRPTTAKHYTEVALNPTPAVPVETSTKPTTGSTAVATTLASDDQARQAAENQIKADANRVAVNVESGLLEQMKTLPVLPPGHSGGLLAGTGVTSGSTGAVATLETPNSASGPLIALMLSPGNTTAPTLPPRTSEQLNPGVGPATRSGDLPQNPAALVQTQPADGEGAPAADTVGSATKAGAESPSRPGSAAAKLADRGATQTKPTANGAGVSNAASEAAKTALPYGGTFVTVAQNAVASVGIPADTGSYAAIKRAILAGRLPARVDVRTEELLNLFQPELTTGGKGSESKGRALTATIEATEAPWAPQHRLVRVALLAGSNPTKDVKVDVEFNPRRVAMYRLIGYEKATPADLSKSVPGEATIEAGRVVVAMFEIIPAVSEPEPSTSDEGYGPVRHLVTEEKSRAPAALLILRVQSRNPDGSRDRVTLPFVDGGQTFAAASDEFKFSTGVAAYGMILAESTHRARATIEKAIAWTSMGTNSAEKAGPRGELLEVMRRTRDLVQ